jgi:carboxylesterase type B
LILDVYVPKGSEERKELLPVMLWIHGGDYQWGGAADRESGPMNASAGTITVVIN